MRRWLVYMLLAAGLGCTLLSIFLLWSAIPVGAEDIRSAPDALHILEPWVTFYYRLAAVAVGVALVVLWWLGREKSDLVVASLWLVALMLYPFGAMVWDPFFSGNAAWLEAQHRNLAWSGGDLNMSVEQRVEGQLDKLYLTDLPRKVNPVEMADWLPSELSLARLPELVDRLGYSDKFFEFIRPGWIAAMAGSAFLLIWLCNRQEAFDVGRGLRATAIVFLGFLGSLLAGWIWSFWAVADLGAAAESPARGEYPQALARMDRAAAKLPVLREDTYFLAQIGFLENNLGRDTPAARLHRANVLNVSSRDQQSDTIYRSLTTDPATPSGVRREACRASLRAAVDALNAARTNAAVHLLEAVLAVEPCNLKANYALQVAYLRTGNFQQVPPLVARMDAVYHYFQFPSRWAVESAAHQNAIVADYAMGNLDSLLEHVRKVVDP